MNRKKIFFVAVILAVVTMFGYFILNSNDFVYGATLEVTKVDISSRINSVIKDINFAEGDTVQAGQTIVTMGGEDVEVNLDLAKKSYERAKKLLRAGSINQENFDQIENRFHSTDIQWQWCQVKSPIEGRIINVYYEAGEWVTVGKRLLTIGNLKEVWAHIYIAIDKVPTVKVGQKIKARLPELDDKEITGVIRYISDEAEFTPKNVQTQEERSRLIYRVKIVFANPDETLKAGQSVEIFL